MKKFLIIFYTIISLCMFSTSSKIKLKDLSTAKIRDGGDVVGYLSSRTEVNYELNVETPHELLLYFKIAKLEREKEYYEIYKKIPYRNKIFGIEKERVLEFFKLSNLDLHYSQNYIKLKNGEKFLYGKFISDYRDNIKLELYFVDRNNREYKKIFYKYANDANGPFSNDDCEENSVCMKIFELLDDVDKFNKGKIEGYTMSDPSENLSKEKITMITHKKILYMSEERLDGLGRKIYESLLDLFKDEIPEQFFEARRYGKMDKM